MDQNVDMPAPLSDPSPFRKVGVWAILTGALALVLVFAQIVGPSLEPHPSAATQVGEMAGQIKRAAWRTFLGLPKPEPEVVSASIWDYFALAAPILGVLSILLAVVSGLKREHWRLPTYATGLAVGAIVFQYFWWMALLIAGVVVLVAVIENIGDIFSF